MARARRQASLLAATRRRVGCFPPPPAAAQRYSQYFCADDENTYQAWKDALGAVMKLADDSQNQGSLVLGPSVKNPKGGGFLGGGGGGERPSAHARAESNRPGPCSVCVAAAGAWEGECLFLLALRPQAGRR